MIVDIQGAAGVVEQRIPASYNAENYVRSTFIFQSCHYWIRSCLGLQLMEPRLTSTQCRQLRN